MVIITECSVNRVVIRRGFTVHALNNQVRLSGLLSSILYVSVLLMIFSFLDDISLCMVGQVSQWWQELAGERDEWKKHVLTRWPLFRPDSLIESWQQLYIKL